eukprot:2202138-Prymnesium_polylepis.1
MIHSIPPAGRRGPCSAPSSQNAKYRKSRGRGRTGTRGPPYTSHRHRGGHTARVRCGRCAHAVCTVQATDP